MSMGLGQAVLTVLTAIAFPAAIGCVLYGYFVLTWRRFERQVAVDLVRDWEMRLELLDGDERSHARRNPPWNVVEALVRMR